MNTKIKKLIALLLSSLMLFALFAGCTPADDADEPNDDVTPPSGDNGDTSDDAGPDTLNFLTWIKSTTYDLTAGGIADKGVNHALFDTLVKFSPTGEIEPMLAESWEESEGGMVYTFKLKEGVKFHDGSDFDADDVVYFFEMAATTNYAARITPYVTNVEKIDQFTVKMTKPNVYTAILPFLAENVYVMPSDLHADDPVAFNENPVGTGPYKFISKGTDGVIKLEANPDYHAGAPEVEFVNVMPMLDPSSAVIALETGDVDFIVAVPESQHSIINSNEDLVLTTTPSWASNMMVLMGDKLNSDINLRKAIYYGVSRENAVITATESTGTVAEEIFSSRLMQGLEGEVPMEGYDEAKAKEHLEMSDYDGSPIYITITADAVLAQSIQADLQAIGIDVQIDQVDTAALVQKLNTGEVDIYLASMGTSTMTPQSLIYTFRADGPQLGENMYHSDEYIDVVAKFATLTDDANMRELTIEGLNLLRDDFNLVNLYESSVSYAHSKDFTYDYPMSASTYVYYYNEIKPAN